jgi:TrmH family RNA methyltransferase
VPKDGIPIFDYKFKEKFILSIGSEAHGISEKLLKSSNDQITIPISNKVESLNAAVAGSMMMIYSSK